MSKIVWTPEDGWTDDGPEATVHVDERGRIHARPNPEHVEGADLWDCPCRECTALDHSAGDTGMSLAEHRRYNFPEHYAK